MRKFGILRTDSHDVCLILENPNDPERCFVSLNVNGEDATIPELGWNSNPRVFETQNGFVREQLRLIKQLRNKNYF